MQPFEKLEAAINAGNTVELGGNYIKTIKALEEAYPAAKEAFDAAQKTVTPTAPFPPVESPDTKALMDRNNAQADLIEVLTKDPEDLKRLDKAGLAAIAKFEGVEGVDGRTSAEKLHEAILAKRGA